MARQAPDLQAVDFLSLGKFQAYANLTAGGAPAGWALIRTLPPPPDPTGLGDTVRNRSRERYATPLDGVLLATWDRGLGMSMRMGVTGRSPEVLRIAPCSSRTT